MATITPNMSLTTWTDPTDFFSHAALAANFTALDQHDHSSSKGVQISQSGLANLSVGTAQIQNAAVTGAKAANNTFADGNLVSANNVVYKNLFADTVTVAGSTIASTFYFSVNGTLVNTGTNVTTSTNAVPSPVIVTAADLAVGGLTPRLRIKGSYSSNSVSSGTSTFSFGLYPLTVGGAASNISFTLGSVVAGSTLSIVPVTSTVVNAIGTDFTLPPDGRYCLGVTIGTASVAATHLGAASLVLQTRNT